jgi:hypothetical protein
LFIGQSRLEKSSPADVLWANRTAVTFNHLVGIARPCPNLRRCRIAPEKAFEYT